MGAGASRTISGALSGATALLPEGLRAALPAPGSGWRIYAINPPMPTLDPATWRLRVDGLVEQPLDLDYQQLLAPSGAPNAMLAYAMDGLRLAREHGAPLRVVMPSMYGGKSVKWVERIIVADAPVAGYWEQRGYDTDAWVGASNGYG